MLNVDVPVKLDASLSNSAPRLEWGSDAIALSLRQIGLKYVALTPGVSFRGLQDSIVNLLGNEQPQTLLCLHEEHAVAIAHGYAKITGEPIGALLHCNVGLMHATMAVFNAWCDRMPIVLLGATGPVDAAKRRPWIDWIHTAKDQGALIRDFIKWDDQPASIPAAFEAAYRAATLARTQPCGPVYLCYDAAMQETALPDGFQPPDAAPFQPALPAYPNPEATRTAAARLRDAKRPVILAGRASRLEADWDRRVRLAETLNARVLTDMKVGAAFPTDHELHAAPPVFFPSQAAEVLADADVILSLDWFDLAGTLAAAGTQSERCVIHASVDLYSHRGWSMDYQGLPPVDIGLLCASDQAVAALLDELPKADRADRPSTERKAVRQPAAPTAGAHAGPLMLSDLGHALAQVTKGLDVTLTRVPIGWPSASWPIRGPLDYIGGDGGGGVGGGLGISIGAALALLHSGRIPVGIVGDGDYIMGVNAMWTAAHCRIPLLIVVANNHSFYVDELHQETIARQRSRPTENKWIGQRIEDPRPDLAGLARAQGVEAIGPVENWDGLVEALAKGVAAVRDGAPFVVDVSIQPGYEGPMAPAIARAMARK